MLIGESLTGIEGSAQRHKHWALALGIIIAYVLSELYLGTFVSPELDRLLLIRIAALSFLALSIWRPEMILGVFMSGVLSFIFMLTAPRLNEISGWSLLPPVAVALYFIARGKKVVICRGPLVYAQMAFAVVLAAGLVYTREYEDGLLKVWMFSYYNVMPFVCAMVFAGDQKRLRNIVLSFWFGVLIWTVGGPFVVPEIRMARLSPEFAGPVGYGRIAGLGGIFVAWLLLSYRGKPLVKAIFVSAGLWGLYNMVATGTRGVMVSFIIAMVAIIHGRFRRIMSARSFASCLLSLIVLGGAIYYGPQDQVERLLSVEGYRAELTSPSVQDRGFLYSEAWNMFISSPLVGMGTSAFVAVSNYPHNIFLEVAVEGGIIGLTIFSLFVFLSLRYAWLLVSKAEVSDMRGRLGLLLYGGLVFILGEAQFSLDILGNRLIWFFSGLIWAVYNSMDGGEDGDGYLESVVNDVGKGRVGRG